MSDMFSVTFKGQQLQLLKYPQGLWPTELASLGKLDLYFGQLKFLVFTYIVQVDIKTSHFMPIYDTSSFKVSQGWGYQWTHINYT